MHKNFKNNTTGVYSTSYYLGVILASANEISKVLGKGVFYNTFDTKREWHRMTADGIPFAIYDYKEYRKINASDVIEYHIGARSEMESKKVVKMLKEAGLNSYTR